MSQDEQGEFGLGHNSGVLRPFDDEVLKTFIKDQNAIGVFVNFWKKTEVTEKNEGKLAEAIEKTRNLFSEIENARTYAKAPFLAEGKRIDKLFRGPKAEVESNGKTLKGILNKWIQKKEAAERDRLAKEAAEAREKAAEERRLAQIKEAELNTKDQKAKSAEIKDAIEKRRAADKAEAEAEKARQKAESDVRVTVGGGTGKRAIGQRTRLSCAITDYELAFMEFCETEQIREVLVKLANQRANSKDFDKSAGIPGFKITETKTI